MLFLRLKHYTLIVALVEIIGFLCHIIVAEVVMENSDLVFVELRKLKVVPASSLLIANSSMLAVLLQL